MCVVSLEAGGDANDTSADVLEDLEKQLAALEMEVGSTHKHTHTRTLAQTKFPYIFNARNIAWF